MAHLLPGRDVDDRPCRGVVHDRVPFLVSVARVRPGHDAELAPKPVATAKPAAAWFSCLRLTLIDETRSVLSPVNGTLPPGMAGVLVDDNPLDSQPEPRACGHP